MLGECLGWWFVGLCEVRLSATPRNVASRNLPRSELALLLLSSSQPTQSTKSRLYSHTTPTTPSPLSPTLFPVMAIDKKGSGRGKNWPTAKPTADGETAAPTGKQPQQTPWSRRVQEAPKPLSAKHIATAKEKKQGKKAEGGAEGEVKASADKAAAAPVEAAAVASPAAGGKKRKAAEDKESAPPAAAVASPAAGSSKKTAAAKPSPATKKSKAAPAADAAADEPSSSTPTASKKSKAAAGKKPDPSPAPAASSSKAKLHFLKDDPIPLLKGLETGNGYHSTSEDDEDSSDDEDESDGEGADSGPVEGVGLMKLPTIAKDDASVKRKLEKAKKTGVSTPFVITMHASILSSELA